MAKKPSAPAKKAFTHKDGMGSLFYDAPGAPTMSGSFNFGGVTYDVTAEPANDKNKKEYLRVTANGVSGALYDNERATSDRHPVKTGPIEVAGRKQRIAAWTKQTQTGENAGQNYLSIAISDLRPAS
ncbi:hypothetical protein [Sphingomonas sp. 3-13AW]|uniref:hypothetical protein n=1 Tax=Sphingomonas sp. 3-13AW TaxID=3050450 RepID=UPI003BB49876